MNRSFLAVSLIIATTLGCTQHKSSTVTETIPDSTLPAGSKKTSSVTSGGATYITERVSTDTTMKLSYGNFRSSKKLTIVSNGKQLTYQGDGEVVEILGDGNVVTLPGNWSFISLLGNDNIIRANSIETVDLTGNSNTVQWKKLSVENTIIEKTGEGRNNTVVQVAE